MRTSERRPCARAWLAGSMLVDVMVLMGEGQFRGSSTTLNKRQSVSENSRHAATRTCGESRRPQQACIVLSNA
jgi:hypothetical protein